MGAKSSTPRISTTAERPPEDSPEQGKRFPQNYIITAAQGTQCPDNARKYGQNSSAGAPHSDLLKGIQIYTQDKHAQTLIQAIQGSYVSEMELAKYFRERLEKSHDVFMETPRLRRLNAQRKDEEAKREAWREHRAEHPNSTRKMPRHHFWTEIPSTQYNTLNFRRLNKKVAVFAPQDPSQNEDPTTGHKDLPQDYLGVSVILPHTKQRLVSVSKDVAGKLPRLLLTTGCCTHPNYNETNRTGKKATRHHQYGFCVVEVIDEKIYLPRIVPARTDGTFIDLGMKYFKEKDPTKAKVEALIIGDSHVPFQDPGATQATKEMIETLSPKSVYIHDLLDFYSINRFNEGDALWQMFLIDQAKEKGFPCDSLEWELEQGYGYLKEISELQGSRQVYVVPSNHDMFLWNYLAKSRDRKDRNNSRIGSAIFNAMHKGDNPLQRGLELIGKIPSNVRFLALTEDSRPWGYECSCHGHLGVNGTRGSLKSFRVSYGKGVIGHTHQLEVLGNTISVGTTSQIPLEYQEGQPSTTMHGNALVYEGGLAQAVPIIFGKWRNK